MLLAFGSNGSGQLGVGHTNDLSYPQQIVAVGHENEPTWGVKQLAAGGNHTVILCDDGKLRAAGNNADGRCSNSTDSQLLTFIEVSTPLGEEGESLTVLQVAAAWSATFILCSNDRVYARGSGYSGELGLGPGIVDSPLWQQVPVMTPTNDKVVYLTAGMAHIVAILSTGRVYGWGKARNGQLKRYEEDLWLPHEINIDWKATKAACGRNFTYLVGESSLGRAEILGPRTNDRFGITTNAPDQLSEWQDVAASWGSIFRLQPQGQLEAWGRNDHGQLPGADLPQIAKFAAGSEHCLALTKAGEVLTWGWGEHGNCGQPVDAKGDVKNRWNEIPVSGKVSAIFAGCATSFIDTSLR